MPIDASEVLAALANMPEEQEAACIKALTDACMAVETEAKRECPYDDGTLRQSITTSVEKEDGKLVGYVGTNISYAPYVHEGTGIYSPLGRKQVPWKYKDLETGEWRTTKGQKPNPFLQKAVDSKRQEILSYFKGVLDDGSD